MKRMSKAEWTNLLTVNGANTPQAKIDETYAIYSRDMDVVDRIEQEGMKVSYRNHLLKMTNVQWRGGRLHDGIMHRQYQVTVSGKTYGWKDDLKAMGFRWDSQEKLWYRPMDQKGKSIHDHLEVAKAEIYGLLTGDDCNV